MSETIEEPPPPAKPAIVRELTDQERRPAALLILLGIGLVLALFAARAARDALFVAALPASELPRAYALSALAMAAAAAIAARWARSARPEVLYSVFAALFGSVLLSARLLAEASTDSWLPFALWIAVDAGTAGALALLVALVDTRLPGRVDARLHERVEVAKIALGAVAALWALALLALVPARDLLVFAAGYLWLSCIPAVLLTAVRRAPRGAARAGNPISGLIAAGTSLDLGLAATAATIGAVVGVIVDAQLKRGLAGAFPGDADRLACAFVGLSLLGAAAAASIRFVLSPLLRHRLGVTSALAIGAAGVALGEGLLLVTPALWAIVIARAPQDSIRLGSADGTLSRVLKPVPRRLRDHWSALVEELLRPLGCAAGALALLLAGHDARFVPAVALASIAALVLVLRGIRDEHARSVGLSRRRWVEPADVLKKLFGAGTSSRSLVAALESGDPKRVRSALELAPLVDGDLTAAVASQLDSPDPNVRRLVLDYLGKKRAAEYVDRIEPLLRDPVPTVRPSAVRAYVAIKGEAASAIVAPLLQAKEPAMTAAAVVGLASALPEGERAQRVGPAIGRLARFSDPIARIKAAEAVATVADPGLEPVLLGLLDDDDPAVRRAAVEAAGRLKTEGLLRPVLRALSSSDTARGAEIALSAWGPAALERALILHGEDRATAAGIARALGKIATPEAVRVLVDALSIESELVRGAVCRSLARIARAPAPPPLERARLEAACRIELAAALRVLAAAEAFALPDTPRSGASGCAPEIQGVPDDPEALSRVILGWALDEAYDRAVDRLFHLIAAIDPSAISAPPDIASRAAVVEALASRLDPQLARGLLKLCSGLPREDRLRGATGLLKPPLLSDEAWARELLGDEDAWTVTAAAHWVGARRLEAAKPLLRALLEHRSAIVREAVLQALERLEPIEALPRAVAPLLWEESGPIRTRVDRLLERIVDQAELRHAHGEVERVVFS